MAINIGDMIIYVDEEKNGECIKGEIVDIWRNHSNEITDYFIALDSGLYTHVKPNYPNWSKLDNRFLDLEKNGFSFSFLSPRCALLPLPRRSINSLN
jgi:hypothetical protein